MLVLKCVCNEHLQYLLAPVKREDKIVECQFSHFITHETPLRLKRDATWTGVVCHSFSTLPCGFRCQKLLHGLENYDQSTSCCSLKKEIMLDILQAFETTKRNFSRFEPRTRTWNVAQILKIGFTCPCGSQVRRRCLSKVLSHPNFQC